MPPKKKSASAAKGKEKKGDAASDKYKEKLKLASTEIVNLQQQMEIQKHSLLEARRMEKLWRQVLCICSLERSSEVAAHTHRWTWWVIVNSSELTWYLPVMQRCEENQAEFERCKQELQDIAQDMARKSTVSRSHCSLAVLAWLPWKMLIVQMLVLVKRFLLQVQADQKQITIDDLETRIENMSHENDALHNQLERAKKDREESAAEHANEVS
jgi:hypothetical protein